MDILIILFLLGCLVWFWYDSLKSRERAVKVAAYSCQRANVQLLDQTVSLERIKPQRNKRGQIAWYRIYGFDFSVQGHERRRGRVFLLGQVLEQIQMDVDDLGTVIDVQESD